MNGHYRRYRERVRRAKSPRRPWRGSATTAPPVANTERRPPSAVHSDVCTCQEYMNPPSCPSCTFSSLLSDLNNYNHHTAAKLKQPPCPLYHIKPQESKARRHPTPRPQSEAALEAIWCLRHRPSPRSLKSGHPNPPRAALKRQLRNYTKRGWRRNMPSAKAGPSLYTLTLPAYLSYLAQEVKGGGHGKSTKSTNTYCWTEMASNSALTHLRCRVGGEGPL